MERNWGWVEEHESTKFWKQYLARDQIKAKKQKNKKQ